MTPARFAATIGNQKSYDQALLEDGPQFKLGAQPDIDPDDTNPPYGGGWVWRTAEEARAFIRNQGLWFEPAVYELELPDSWEVNVFPEPDPMDGVHRLRHNARIVRRVDFEPSG